MLDLNTVRNMKTKELRALGKKLTTEDNPDKADLYLVTKELSDRELAKSDGWETALEFAGIAVSIALFAFGIGSVAGKVAARQTLKDAHYQMDIMFDEEGINKLAHEIVTKMENLP